MQPVRNLLASKMLVSMAALGVLAGGVSAQEEQREEARPEAVIEILERLRDQLGEKELSDEERQRVVEALTRATRQLEGLGERSRKERTAERDLARQMEQVERARAQLERERAKIERAARDQRAEVERAREEVRAQAEQVRREAQEGAERARAEVREVAERARREAVELRERARGEAREHAERARREAGEVRQREQGEGVPLLKDVPVLRHFFDTKSGDGDGQAKGLAIVRGDDGEALRIVGLEDITTKLKGLDPEKLVKDLKVLRLDDIDSKLKGLDAQDVRVLRFDDGTKRASEARARAVVGGQVVGGQRDGEDVDVVVRPGDSVVGIAKRVLGDADHWRAIVEANPGLDATRLRVGQHLVMPKASAAPRAAHDSGGTEAHAPGAEHHVHTHVHHHYNAAPEAGGGRRGARAVQVPAPPAPAEHRAPPVPVAPGAAAAPRAAGVVRAARVATRAPVALRAQGLRPGSAAPARARMLRSGEAVEAGDAEVRDMVEELRVELRETRSLVEELRKQLAEREQGKGSLH